MWIGNGRTLGWGLAREPAFTVGLLHALTEALLRPVVAKEVRSVWIPWGPAQDRLQSWKSRRTLEHCWSQTERLGDWQLVWISYKPFMSDCPCRNLTPSSLPRWDPELSTCHHLPQPPRSGSLAPSPNPIHAQPEASSLVCNLANSLTLWVSGPEFPLSVLLPCHHVFFAHV